MSKPLIIAHRGDPQSAPENTLPAFASAIEKGIDGIELDVHQTRDGALVVHHFFGLGTTTSGSGLLMEKTLAEIKQSDAGSWFSSAFAGVQVPTLAEVLDLGKGKVHFEIDLKGSSLQFLQTVIAEVERFDVEDNVELTTAHYALLYHAKRLNPRLRKGTFFNPPPDWMPIHLAQQHVLDWATLFEIQVAHVNRVLLTDEFVEELHRHNLLVHGSNLSTQEEIEQGLSIGIDRFSTEEIELALQVRDEFLEHNR